MMPASAPPPASFVELSKPHLQQVIDALRRRGYRTVGPRVADGAIVLADFDRCDQLPWGVLDEQDGGRYRLRPDPQAGAFDHVVGPHSLKPFVFPPRETVLQLARQDGRWSMESPDASEPPVAVFGVRGCDLHALRIQDRVFLEGAYVDPGYRRRRERLFLVGVNCRRAAATCFCHSMNTGPALPDGFDLGLTELDDRFVVQAGSPRGAEVLAETTGTAATPETIAAARDVSTRLSRALHDRAAAPADGSAPRPRSLDTTGLPEFLLSQLQHPRWQATAERCLACANCTLVCPTCFCSHVEEVSDLTGDHVRRERSWASCFSSEHSAMNAGVVRPTIAAQYRQWLTHKLASWVEQFGTSGCVGCGRCITWCPVGIDLTEEVAALRAAERT